MSKEKEIAPEVTLNSTDLLALILKMQQDAAASQAKQTELLAQALQDSRKPYVDPKQEENRLASNKTLREIEHNKLRRSAAMQAACEHEQGMTGDERNGKGAVCMYCQKVISSVNPKHGKYFRKKSGRVAEAGQFMLNDPIESALARLTEEDKAKVRRFRQEAPAASPVQYEED